MIRPTIELLVYAIVALAIVIVVVSAFGIISV